MLSSQLKLSLSYYSDLYDMIVPKDHIPVSYTHLTLPTTPYV